MYKTFFIAYPPTLCRNIKNRPHSLWVDNFNKMSKWQIPSAEKEMYALMNWTGYALRLYPFEIDMTFRKDPYDNEVVPAMPIEPLKFLPRVLEKMKRFVYDGKENPSRKFLDSLSVLWAVHNVPVAPDAKNTVIPAEFANGIAAKRDRLRNLHPEKLIDENIGSNKGLARVLRDIHDERGWGIEEHEENAPTEYSVLNVDCNIFDRILKVHHFSTPVPTVSHNHHTDDVRRDWWW